MLAEDRRERDTAVRDGHVDIARSRRGSDDRKAVARHRPEAERETLESHAASAGHESCDPIKRRRSGVVLLRKVCQITPGSLRPVATRCT